MDKKRVILSVDTSTPVISLALLVGDLQSNNTAVMTEKWQVESSVAEELLLNIDLFLEKLANRQNI